MRTAKKVQLSDFSGSYLRGAFGHSLRKAVCIRPGLECVHCNYNTQCGYYQLFESIDQGLKLEGFANKPHPYVLKLDHSNQFSQDNDLVFSLVLLGDWSRYLAYLVFAFKDMGNRGFGKARHRFELDSVEDGVSKEVLYEGKNLCRTTLSLSTLRDYVEASMDKGNFNHVLLSFLTPVKMVRKGVEEVRLTDENLQFAIKRRYETMHRFYGFYREVDLDHLDLKVKAIDEEHQSWVRYSNRQGRKHPMSGISGSYLVSIRNAKSAEILKSMEILHLGKNTSFGLGEVRVNPV